MAISAGSHAAWQRIEAVGEEKRMHFGSESNMKRLKKVNQYAKKHKVSISEAVLEYITCCKLSSVVVIGSRNIDQLKDSLQAADIGTDLLM
jgi:aryl-alcohol dehydrogenase-like predicted oxidoreductase